MEEYNSNLLMSLEYSVIYWDLNGLAHDHPPNSLQDSSKKKARNMRSKTCSWNTIFPRIVSSLELFPPLNSFRTFMYCDQRSQYIKPNSKNNSFRGNYSRKYGILLPGFIMMTPRLFINYKLKSAAHLN